MTFQSIRLLEGLFWVTRDKGVTCVFTDSTSSEGLMEYIEESMVKLVACEGMREVKSDFLTRVNGSCREWKGETQHRQ